MLRACPDGRPFAFALGASHPHNAPLPGMQGNYAEAEPLYERAQAILEKVLGLEHPDVAVLLSNRATSMKMQARLDVLSGHVVPHC